MQGMFDLHQTGASRWPNQDGQGGSQAEDSGAPMVRVSWGPNFDPPLSGASGATVSIAAKLLFEFSILCF